MAEYAARQLGPNALFDLRFVHDARLSPDGRKVVYVVSRTVEAESAEYFEIVVEDLATGARRDLNFDGAAGTPRWSPDGTRFAFIGDQRLYVAPTDASGFTALSPEVHKVQGSYSWAPDSQTIAYTSASVTSKPGNVHRITKRIFRSEGLGIADDLVLKLHLARLTGGPTEDIVTGLSVAMQPAFSPCGKWLLFLGSDAAVGMTLYGGLRLMTVNLDDGTFTEVAGEGWLVGAAAWSPCGERVVIAGAYKSAMTVPTIGLWVIDSDGSNARCRTEGFTGNVGLRMHHDMATWGTSQNHFFAVPDPRHAYVSVTTRGCVELWRIALDGEIAWDVVARGPRTCVIMDASARHDRLLFGVSDMHAPTELYTAHLDGSDERALTTLNRDVLAHWPRMITTHMSFKSEDGLPLEGWVLARADRPGSQPAVMFIHGGPMLAAGHVFRFDLHLLAANGYSVVFSNFRGSEGYGEKFTDALKGDWGGLGFPDHMATADAAVTRGLADPARLGVWGPSHGGFATAWVVGHTTRFRAAVAESASTDWTMKYYLSDATAWIVRDLGGRPDEIPDIYRALSPLTYAARCRTPTLLLHGEDDARCPIATAEAFYRALHDVGCTTELVRIPRMKHMGDSTGPLSCRLAQNEALLEWFERFL